MPAKSVEGKQPAWDQAWTFRGPAFHITCNAGWKDGRATLGWAEEGRAPPDLGPRPGG